MRRYAGLVVAAVRGVAREAGEVEDLTQEVFLRLVQGRFPAAAQLRPGPRRAVHLDHDRRPQHRAGRDAPLPAGRRCRSRTVPEGRLAIDPVEPVRKLKLPEALLSPRQREILTMLYDHEMDVSEVASALGIDPQTVRSAHHKAMIKLRAYFRAEVE